MKQSQVKPGVRALLSLGGRRGAVAVTVVELSRTGNRVGSSASPDRWLVRQTGGVNVGAYHVATARQLRPLPVTDASGKLIGWAGADGAVYPELEGKRFTGLGYETA